MELRSPPSVARPAVSLKPLWALQIITLLVVIAAAFFGFVQKPGDTGDNARAARAREVASKLKAAGAVNEAAGLYAAYLEKAAGDPQKRASVAYSLGQLFLERGRYEEALRWFYEAESLGAGALAEEVNQKIVHALERLGRVHAAQAALNARTGMPAGGDKTQHPAGDPVVARIGTQEIRRSDVERSLDELPPELKRYFAGDAQKAEYLKKFVAEELLWRKAEKLEYSKDPEVRRQLEALLKQLVVRRFIEREIVGKITVDEADLKTYHEANRVQYDLRASARVRVIKVADFSLGEEIVAQLKGGSDFAKLVATHSLHEPRKKAGGELKGWVFRGDDFMGLGDPPAAILLSDEVFATAKGKISAPVIAGGNTYVFEVIDRREGKAQPFDKVRADVERDYRRMKMTTAYGEVVEQQLASEEVEIFAEAMRGP